MAAMTPLTMPWSIASNIHPIPMISSTVQVIFVIGNDSMRCEMLAMRPERGLQILVYKLI